MFEQAHSIVLYGDIAFIFFNDHYFTSMKKMEKFNILKLTPIFWNIWLINHGLGYREILGFDISVNNITYNMPVEKEWSTLSIEC